MSFFPPASLFARPAPIRKIPQCGACGLLKTCKTPKMAPSGKGRKKILIVAEAPGATEDEEGIQLVGKTGRFFEEEIAEYGIDLRSDCILTSTLICRPPGNRTPTIKEIDYCLPNLQNTIAKVKPEVIITLGLPALKAVLRDSWNASIKEINPWIGRQIPSQKLNAWVCPVYHPSFVMREIDNAKGGSAAPALFRRHLKSISKLRGVPWPNGLPNYKQQVEAILDDAKAARIIRSFIRRGGAGAFDYETNMLKPDRKIATIRTASICWRGRRTIAFPFQGDAVVAFKEWIQSPCQKIAQNFKFEDRWTRAKLGIEVNNWEWCTMNQGHIVDSRSGCTSLGFLALNYLGQSSWDDNVHPFLVSDYSNKENRIWDIDIEDLCLYNGIDSLVEYMIAVKQRELLGMPKLK